MTGIILRIAEEGGEPLENNTAYKALSLMKDYYEAAVYFRILNATGILTAGDDVLMAPNYYVTAVWHVGPCFHIWLRQKS